MTSGQAARISLEKENYGKSFFHLGPERDNVLYSGLNIEKTVIEQCDFILCTGLFDDQMEDLNFYKSLLEKYSKKKTDMYQSRFNGTQGLKGRVLRW